MINFPSHTSPLPKCLVQGQVVTKIRNQSKGCPRRDFRGGPVDKTPCSHAGGPGSIPGWGTKILHVELSKIKTKRLSSSWDEDTRSCFLGNYRMECCV